MSSEGLNSSSVLHNGEQSRQLEMDVLVGYILLGGVLLSMVLIFAGLVWKYVQTGGVRLDYELAGMNLFQFVVSEVHLAVLREVRPRLLVNMGIVVLMLTPFFRVLASVVYFLVVLKNWKYTVFTLFVLLVLTGSLFLR
ncbi:MAG TPA: DUF1634 domain-containing protein [Terriglobales bacterium]|nr:DUF1634 domain-containing protein [Terriglobales bacterium]